MPAQAVWTREMAICGHESSRPPVKRPDPSVDHIYAEVPFSSTLLAEIPVPDGVIGLRIEPPVGAVDETRKI